jgi:phage terminase small subunit
MRGRKPKPTHLKLVEGNPGKRKINRKEPVPRNKLLSPPGHFNEEQQATWTYFIANSPKGLLKAVDTSLLAAYVMAVYFHREATIKLQHSPIILKEPAEYRFNPLT